MTNSKEKLERLRNLAGKEWWGKRPLSCTGVSQYGMKSWKRLLHKKERLEGKQTIVEQLND